MSAFREAVAAMNQRTAKDGHASWPAPPEMECVKCQQPRQIFLTTIFGKTRAHCECCAHDWEIEA